MFDNADSDFSTDSEETGTPDIVMEVDQVGADDIAAYRDLLEEIASVYSVYIKTSIYRGPRYTVNHSFPLFLTEHFCSTIFFNL